MTGFFLAFLLARVYTALVTEGGQITF